MSKMIRISDEFHEILKKECKEKETLEKCIKRLVGYTSEKYPHFEEYPCLTLETRDFEGGHYKKIYLSQLKDSKKGEIFRVNTSNGYVKEIEEEGEIIYKDDNSCLMKITTIFKKDQYDPYRITDETVEFISYNFLV